jgi:hypothetical protein
MDVLGDISLLTVAVVCCVSCAGGLILLFVIGIAADILGAVFGIVEIGFDLFNAGPVPGCGCVLVIGVCGSCSAFTYFALQTLSTCGTPDAVNFCRLLP